MSALLVILALQACGGPVLEELVNPPIPDPPWKIDYSDGSGNAYFFEGQPAGTIQAVYRPVDPAQSSSGTYSGGEPWSVDLDVAGAGELWRWVEGLAADETIHVQDRQKGTGVVHLVSAQGDRSFIVMRGTRLAAFDTYVSSLGDQP